MYFCDLMYEVEGLLNSLIFNHIYLFDRETIKCRQHHHWYEMVCTIDYMHLWNICWNDIAVRDTVATS